MKPDYRRTLKEHRIYEETLSDTGLLSEIEACMKEHASNELASYKAELRDEIRSRAFNVDDPAGNQYIVMEVDELLALLEDNPTEK